METIKILPITLYKFQCPENILQEVDEELSNIDFRKNQQNKVTQDEIQNKALKKWICESLKIVKQEIFGDTKWDLFITSIWANKANMGQFHHKHVHPNSFLSGILYLNDLDKGGETVFYNNNPYWRWQTDYLLYLNHKVDANEIIDTVNSERGKLIIFPSTLWHSVRPLLKPNQIRHTVSFNTFLEGDLGSLSQGTSMKIKNGLD